MKIYRSFALFAIVNTKRNTYHTRYLKIESILTESTSLNKDLTKINSQEFSKSKVRKKITTF